VSVTVNVLGEWGCTLMQQQYPIMHFCWNDTGEASAREIKAH